MKRLWSAVILLLVILGMCVGSAVIVDKFAETAVSHLENSAAAAERKDFKEATKSCTAASEHWHAKAGLLGALLRHSEADDVEKGLAQLIAYAETEDHDEFLALCAEVIHDIRHVRDMELPLLRNIL